MVDFLGRTHPRFRSSRRDVDQVHTPTDLRGADARPGLPEVLSRRRVNDNLADMTGSPNLSDRSDTELWQYVLAGDMDAFHELYGRHKEDVIGFLRARCRGRMDWEALSQEVWARVWARRVQFDGRKFRGWLFEIARNLWIDTGTSAEQRYMHNTPYSEHDAVRCSDDVEHELLEAMNDCLRELGGEFVEVLRLRLGGNTDAEIAAMMGIALGSVYSRANRGREAVRDCIKMKLS